MPKQKYNFTLSYLDSNAESQSMEIRIDFFIKYEFLKRKKESQFHYIMHNGVDHEDISCVKAN